MNDWLIIRIFFKLKIFSFCFLSLISQTDKILLIRKKNMSFFSYLV